MSVVHMGAGWRDVTKSTPFGTGPRLLCTALKIDRGVRDDRLQCTKKIENKY